MGEVIEPNYGAELALVHHRGFGFHADACAPGIIELLQEVRSRRGLVVELGCGSGLLTRHLVDAGHRVIATDASTAMLDIARAEVPGVEDVRRLVLPDDQIPPADAIVSTGHVLNYLPTEAAVRRALQLTAEALRPGGVMAIDLCDVEYGALRANAPNLGRVGEDWAIIAEFSLPSADRFVRHISVFVRNSDGSWRRDDEQHDNVLIDTTWVPDLLARHGVVASLRASFGEESLPAGLRAVVGHRPA